MVAPITHTRCNGNCITASGKNNFVHITIINYPDIEGWKSVKDPLYFNDNEYHWLHPDCFQLYQQWLLEEKYKEEND